MLIASTDQVDSVREEVTGAIQMRQREVKDNK